MKRSNIIFRQQQLLNGRSSLRRKRYLKSLLELTLGIFIILGAISIASGVARSYFLEWLQPRQEEALLFSSAPFLTYETSADLQFLPGENNGSQPALHSETGYNCSITDPDSQYNKNQRISYHHLLSAKTVAVNDDVCLHNTDQCHLPPTWFLSIPIAYRRLII
ncbi:MAG: hypothetical protein WDN75_14195 [Bacteroidota bacterium]